MAVGDRQIRCIRRQRLAALGKITGCNKSRQAGRGDPVEAVAVFIKGIERDRAGGGGKGGDRGESDQQPKRDAKAKRVAGGGDVGTMVLTLCRGKRRRRNNEFVAVILRRRPMPARADICLPPKAEMPCLPG